MWSMVAQRLALITPPAATPDQLWQRVEAAWSAVPQEHIRSLFESTPIRVAAPKPEARPVHELADQFAFWLRGSAKCIKQSALDLLLVTSKPLREWAGQSSKSRKDQTLAGKFTATLAETRIGQPIHELAGFRLWP
ncbi:hypothetical protein TNCV_676741 [Trichonephila clavipes]|nr:hypothetical protein TNCV_676741 [Trichonephila clavipes]